MIEVVYEGRSLTRSLEVIHETERPAIQSLAYASLRFWGFAQTLIGEHLLKKPSKDLSALLVVATTLIKNHGQTQNQYSIPTIVNEAVKAAAMSPKTKHAQGLVNAVLRKIATLPVAQAKSEPLFGLPFPDWWLSRIQAAYPSQWQDICAIQQSPPPLTLRVNQKKNEPDEYGRALKNAGIAYRRIGAIAGLKLSQAIIVDRPLPVSRLPEFAQGAVSVQDAGAQLAAELLQPRAGEYFLDACAAPGGKSAHLLEKMEEPPARFIALEIDEERAKKISNNLIRLGLMNDSIRVVCGDASKQDWWDGTLFDKILLDVPCSASGIVRRHPDIVFLRQEEDLAGLVEIQKTILNKAWSMLKMDGHLLYVTCSIFPQEGEDQIVQFVKDHPNALRLEAPGQLLPCEQHDGFFYGLLKKQSP